jgi:hypothetical protein
MEYIDFSEDVVAPVKATAEMLEERIEDLLPEYAPSIVCRAGGSVTIRVSKNEPLWTAQLERRIREHVSSLTDSTGTPCKLTVTHLN